MISYDFVPISSQKGVLSFETPGSFERDIWNQLSGGWTNL